MVLNNNMKVIAQFKMMMNIIINMMVMVLNYAKSNANNANTSQKKTRTGHDNLLSAFMNMFQSSKCDNINDDSKNNNANINIKKDYCTSMVTTPAVNIQECVGDVLKNINDTLRGQMEHMNIIISYFVNNINYQDSSNKLQGALLAAISSISSTAVTIIDSNESFHEKYVEEILNLLKRNLRISFEQNELLNNKVVIKILKAFERLEVEYITCDASYKTKKKRNVTTKTFQISRFIQFTKTKIEQIYAFVITHLALSTIRTRTYAEVAANIYINMFTYDNKNSVDKNRKRKLSNSFDATATKSVNQVHKRISNVLQAPSHFINTLPTVVATKKKNQSKTKEKEVQTVQSKHATHVDQNKAENNNNVDAEIKTPLRQNKKANNKKVGAKIKTPVGHNKKESKNNKRKCEKHIKSKFEKLLSNFNQNNDALNAFKVNENTYNSLLGGGNDDEDDENTEAKHQIKGTTNDDDDICIVGMGCHLPGDISNIKKFWSHLINKVDIVAKSESNNRANIPCGCLSEEELSIFDNEFFNTTEVEAKHMDVHHRLLLTTSWETLHMCGHDTIEDISGKNVGVFIGAADSDHKIQKENNCPSALVPTSTHGALAANRISHAYNLTGPSLVMNTGQSSSLVALDDACVRIQQGNCDAALVGGVMVTHDPQSILNMKSAGFFSPNNRCKTFDASADGAVRSEACVMVYIMKRKDAIRENRDILAIIRGTSVVSEGRTPSITTPSATMQAIGIRQAIKAANILYDDISFVEVHGSGTATGDLIEVEAIQNSIIKERSKEAGNVILTTAKTSVGHSEAAAGLTGVIKSVLSLIHRQIPPNIHLKNVNPKLNLSNCKLPTKTESLLNTGEAICGVSSLGFGGTFAHVILSNEEYPKSERTREYFDPPIKNNVVYMFSGQGGTKFHGIGKRFYKNEELFRDKIDECAEYLDKELEPYSLKQLLGLVDNSTDDAKLSENILLEYNQPCIFALQVALVALCQRYSIPKPNCVVGHSVGEIAAAVTAGILSLKKACAFVSIRFKAMNNIQEEGKMYAVKLNNELSREEIVELVETTKNVTIGAFNSPRQFVISGSSDHIDSVAKGLERNIEPLSLTQLKVRQGFHSPIMSPASISVRSASPNIFEKINQEEYSNITFVSTVTAKVERNILKTNDYWADQIEKPVLFSDAIEVVYNMGNNIFIEIGPGSVLCKLVNEQKLSNIKCLPIFNRKHHDNEMQNLKCNLESIIESECLPALDKNKRFETNQFVNHIQHTAITGNKSFENIKSIVLNLVNGLVSDTSRVTSTAPFMEMGLNSFSINVIASQLSNQFGTEIKAETLFSYPTIFKLSKYIAGVNLNIPSSRMHQQKYYLDKEPIAVVGMSCRAVGDVNHPLELWSALLNNIDLVGASKKVARQHPQSMIGGFLTQDNVELFDNKFFSISEMEAKVMDPRQRLLLTTTWEALHMATYSNKQALSEQRMAVVVGMSSTDHKLNDPPMAYLNTSTHAAIAANRISYVFGITGPSMVIDTACSSALVALNETIANIQRNDCDSAIVGGINIMQDPQVTEGFIKMGALSPTERCHSFDSRADGYVRSEGCGIIILKRLSDAKAEGLPILSVIHGGSVRNDGETMSLTAPNGSMQAETIRAALSKSNITANDITFIEAHGTGTPLGDPIEIEGIQEAIISKRNNNENKLIVTTAKSSIGHCEAAAGIMGVIKSIMSLINKQIPSNVQLKEYNPKLRLDGIHLPRELYSLSNENNNNNNNSNKIYCGVSSFGFGGTLAHVIMSSYDEYDNNIPDYLKLNNNNMNIRPVFVFSGQGGLDWFNNSNIEDLYINNEVFNKSIHKCCELMNDELHPYTLLQLLNIQDENDKQNQLFVKTDKQILLEYAQPCIFAIQHGLVEVWKSMGIIPSVVLGHSFGEICAAYTAGVMSIEKACEFVLFRNEVMTKHVEANGGMVAVRSSSTKDLEEITFTIADDTNVVVSAYNSSNQLVFSGTKDSLSEFKVSLQKFQSSSNLRVNDLDTSAAFHSHMMSKCSDKLRSNSSPLAFNYTNADIEFLNQPQIQFVSTVTGKLEAEELQSQLYWADQIVKPVLFQQAIETILTDMNCKIFVEIGPSNTMCNLIAHNKRSKNIKLCPSINRKKFVLTSYEEMKLAKLDMICFMLLEYHYKWNMEVFKLFSTQMVENNNVQMFKDDDNADDKEIKKYQKNFSSNDIKLLVLEQLAFTLGGSITDDDLDTPLPNLGLDSLAAIELVNWIKHSFDTEISQLEFLKDEGMSGHNLIKKLIQEAKYIPDNTEEMKEPNDTNNINYIEHPMKVETGKYNEYYIQLPKAFGPNTLNRLIETINEASTSSIIIYGADDETFCLGMDLDQGLSFADSEMGDNLLKFIELSKLLENRNLPTIVYCNGAVRGGGMLFPCWSTICISSKKSTFGFPEIRRNGLPGIVSYAAQNRISDQICNKLFITGDSFTVEEAISYELVDICIDNEELEIFIEKLVHKISMNLHNVLWMNNVSAYTKLLTNWMNIISIDQIEDKVMNSDNNDINIVVIEGNKTICYLKIDQLTNFVSFIAQVVTQNQKLDGIIIQMNNKTADEYEHVNVNVNSDTNTLMNIKIQFDIIMSFKKLQALQIPIICEIDGCINGLSCIISLMCDYRIATNTSSLTLDTIVNVQQIMLIMECNTLISNLINKSGKLSAQECYQERIIHELCDDSNQLQQKSLQFISQVLSNPSQGIYETLGLLRSTIDADNICMELFELYNINLCSGLLVNYSSTVNITKSIFTINLPAIWDKENLLTLIERLNHLECKLIVFESRAEMDNNIIDLNLEESYLFIQLINQLINMKQDYVYNGMNSVVMNMAELVIANYASHVIINRNTKIILASLELKNWIYIMLSCKKYKNRGKLSLNQIYSLLFCNVENNLKYLEQINFIDQLINSDENKEVKLDNIVRYLSLQFDNNHTIVSEPNVDLQNINIQSVDGLKILKFKNSFNILMEISNLLKHVLQDNPDITECIIFDCTHIDMNDDEQNINQNEQYEQLIFNYFVEIIASYNIPLFIITSGDINNLYLLLSLVSDYWIDVNNMSKLNKEEILKYTFKPNSKLIGKVLSDSDHLVQSIYINESVPTYDKAIQQIKNICQRFKSEDMKSNLFNLRKNKLENINYETFMMLHYTKDNILLKQSPIKMETNKYDAYETNINLNSIDKQYVDSLVLQIRKCITPEQICVLLNVTCGESNIECKYVKDLIDKLSYNLKHYCRIPIITVIKLEASHWIDDNVMLESLLNVSTIIVAHDKQLEKNLILTKRVHRLIQYVDDVEMEVNRILRRFQQIGSKKLSICLEYLPAKSYDMGLMAMSKVIYNDIKNGDRNSEIGSLVMYSLDNVTGVCTLTLNNPDQSNAMNYALAEDLTICYHAIQRDIDLIKVVLIKANGNHFCVGGNPFQIRKLLTKPLLNGAYNIDRLYAAFAQLRALPIPIMAAVHGSLIGGGVALLLTADFRISHGDATFEFGNLSRGVCPGMMLSKSLVDNLSVSSAMDIYINNLKLTASDALKRGLINYIATGSTVDDLHKEAYERAIIIAQLSNNLDISTKARISINNNVFSQEVLGICRCIKTGEAFKPQSTNVIKSKHIIDNKNDMSNDHKHDLGDGVNAGIHAMNIYVPNHYVNQVDMEIVHDCVGKYTKGLSQEAIGFCGDDEDAASMALTAVNELMEQTQIPWENIGRLEVGTESLLDRSKSIKTHLMELFNEHNCYNIEGVDNYNACYGGTAALLNTINWIQSSVYDGRWAIVVCVDICDLPPAGSFLCGASAIAMLVGPNAPVIMAPERASYMMNTWDFYKPVGWKDAYPIMKGKYSIECYMKCLNGCYDKLSNMMDDNNLVELHDFVITHCTSTYLCKRAFKQLCANAYKDSNINVNEQLKLYEEKAAPGTLITKLVGSTYTASCYTNLYSLFASKLNEVEGSSILVYSYGSGSASSMFRLMVNEVPFLCESNIFGRLNNRQQHTPEEFFKMQHAYTQSTHGAHNFMPTNWGNRRIGAFYLNNVDANGIRSYKQNGIRDINNFDSSDKIISELPKPILSYIDRFQFSNNSNKNMNDDKVAIIGMSCRIPYFNDELESLSPLNKFWTAINSDVSCFHEVTLDHWYDIDIDNINKDDMIGVKCGLLKTWDEFDAPLFELSEKKAATLLPLHKLVLMVTFEALKDSGLIQVPKDINNKHVGVFVGVSGAEFEILNDRSNVANEDSLGGDNAISGRISQIFGLEGPSISIDTACSSGLVALHLASESIKRNECDTAIVVACSKLSSAKNYLKIMNDTAVISNTFECKPFGKDVNGTVISEGIAVVILQRDSITLDANKYTVVCGSATNQMGKRSYFSLPKVQPQVNVIENALQNSEVTINDIIYVELHGMGSPMGDLIEYESVCNAFKDRNNTLLPLSFYKHKIGHTLATSGLLAIIKSVLCLQNQIIPKTDLANKYDVHPNCNQNEVAFFPTAPCLLSSTNSDSELLYCGVHSYGYSGSNAHVILQHCSKHKQINSKHDTILRVESKTATEVPLEIVRRETYADVPRYVTANQNLLLGEKLVETNESIIWRQYLQLSHYKYLDDHIINNNIIAPGSLYISTSIACMLGNKNDPSTKLNDVIIFEEVQFNSVLSLTNLSNDDIIMNTIYNIKSNNVNIITNNMNNQIRFNCQYVKDNNNNNVIKNNNIYNKIHTIKVGCIKYFNNNNIKHHYNIWKCRGYNYGNEFQLIDEVWIGKNISYSKIKPSKLNSHGIIHPTVLDCCFQSSIYACIMNLNMNNNGNTYVPYRIDNFIYNHKEYNSRLSLYAFVELIEYSNDMIICDIYLCHKTNPQLPKSINNKDNNNCDEYIIIGYINKFMSKSLQSSSSSSMSNHHVSLHWYQSEWEIYNNNINNVEENKIDVDDISNNSNWLLINSSNNKHDTFVKDMMNELILEMKVPNVEYVNHDIILNNNLITNKNDNIKYSVFWMLDNFNDTNNMDKYDDTNGIEMLLYFIKTYISVLDKLYIITCNNNNNGKNILSSSYGHVIGFTKTLITEIYNMDTNDVLINLIDVDKNSTNNILCLQNIIYDNNDNMNNNEYVIYNDQIYISTLRLVNSKSKLNNKSTNKLSNLINNKMMLNDDINWQLIQIEKNRYDSFSICRNDKLKKGQRHLELSSNEILVKFEYYGLNYRDVMLASGSLNSDAFSDGIVQFGLEGSGFVVDIGNEVKSINIGDKVYGMSNDGIVSHGIMNELSCIKVPSNLKLEDVAGVFIPYITAYASLIELANIKKDDIVLIHSAAGGVGSCAVQLAVNVGAIVIGTASTEEKREYVKSLGAKYVYNSRSLEFVNEVRKLTIDNGGVDVVLNSLANEYMIESLNLVAPFGRFIEIGKVDALKHNTLDIHNLLNNITYYFFDLDRYMRKKPKIVYEWGIQVNEMLLHNIIKPPLLTIYSLNKISDALKYLGASKHMGKVLLKYQTIKDLYGLPLVDSHSSTKKSLIVSYPKLLNKICVIIAGTKGIGLRIGAWLITQGINTICLLSRNGHIHNDDEWFINEMKAYNEHVDIIIKSCDVLNEVECENIFNELKSIGSIGGIIYGAAVWSDGLIMNMTNESLHKAMDPKVIGTYNIHRITIDDVEIKESLEFFVVLSSIASVVGAPGLGNYNAGNTYQELLMQYRVNVLNVCGSVLNLGGIIDTGHIMDDESLNFNPKYMLLSSDVIKALEYVLLNQYNTINNDDNVKQLEFQQLIVHKFSADELEMLKHFDKFKYIRSVMDVNGMNTASINSNLNQDKVYHIVLDALKSVLIDDGKKYEDQFLQNETFVNLGIDSLSLNSISNIINAKLSILLPVASLFLYPTVNKLVDYIIRMESRINLGVKKRMGASLQTLELIETTNMNKQNVMSFVSGSQKQVIIHSLMHPESALYNISYVWKYSGKLDYERLINSMKSVALKHKSLLTMFVGVSSSKYIQIIEPQRLNMKWFYTVEEAEFDEWIQKPFDLQNHSLFRLVVSKSKLAFVVHHAVADGLSVQVILSDLSIGYTRNKIEHMQLLQAVDFAVIETNKMLSNQFQVSLDYWYEHGKRLVNNPFVIKVNENRNNENQFKRIVQNYNDNMYQSINSSLDILKSTTKFSLLFAVFKLFMHKWTDLDIVGINTVHANRPPGFDKTVGMFVNTVVYGTDFNHKSNKSLTIRQFIQTIHKEFVNSLEHAWLPMSYVHDYLRSNDFNVPIQGLSNVMFVYQGNQITKQSLDLGNDIKLEFDKYSGGNPQPLTFEIVALENETFKTIIQYNTSMFDNNEMVQMSHRWKQLLHQVFVGSQLDTPLSDITLLAKEDFALINTVNDTYIEWNDATNGTVIEVITKQAELYPNKVALYMNDDKLTYEELMNACFVLSNKLRDEHNIQVGNVVCVCMERSFEMIISIISIMICGGIYCPLHPSEAIERCHKIMKRVDYRLVLCDQRTKSMFGGLKHYAYSINNNHKSSLTRQNKILCSNKDVAYCIFTSGSTGEPKGVLGSHNALYNLCVGYKHIGSIQHDDVRLQMSRCTYDVHIIDIFGTLSVGACLVLFHENDYLRFDKMINYIEKFGVTNMDITSSYATALFNAFPKGYINSTYRLICLGGEAVTLDVVQLIKSRTLSANIINGYGPAESCVIATEYTVCEHLQTQIPIGQPLPNYQCYVLNSKHQLVIPGQVGELFIAGRGLMDGYINQPELTAQRLFKIQLPTQINTFHYNNIKHNHDDNKADHINEILVYRTGDLVYQMNDGNLVYVGRVDHQVKIRGQRVELGEIENVLKAHKLISEIVVVAAKSKNNDTKLVAYISSKNHALYETKDDFTHDKSWFILSSKDTNVLREYCQSNLPIHMHPFTYVVMQKLPLNQNMKVDRKQLPTLAEINVVTNNELKNKIIEENSELNDIEQNVANMWSQILNIDTNIIAKSSNFFQLGGSSLSAAQLISMIRKDVSDEVSIQLIFENPLLRDMCNHIQRANRLRNTNKDEQERVNFNQNIFVTSNHNVLSNSLSVYMRFGLQSLWIAFVLIYLGCSILLPMTIIRESINTFGTDNVIIMFMMFSLSISVIGLELILLMVVTRWCFVSNLKTGVYHMWSIEMIKWWCFHSLLNAFHPLVAFFMVETKWIIYWYRLLGAKIGDNCVIKTAKMLDPFVITIGDNCIINHNTQLLGHRFYMLNDSAVFELCHINIEDNCFIQDRCIVECGVEMKLDSELKAGSVLLYGQVIPSGASYSGNPATMSGQSNNSKLRYYRELIKNLSFSFVQLILVGILLLIILIPFIFGLWISYIIWQETSLLYSIWFFAGLVPYMMAFLICINAICLRWITINVSTNVGRQTLTKTLLIRRWFVDRLVRLLTTLAPFVGGLTFISQLLYYLMGLDIDIFNSQVTDLDIGCDIDLLCIKKGVWCGYNLNAVCSYYVDDQVVTESILIDDGSILGESVMLLPGSIISPLTTIGSNTTLAGDTIIEKGGIYVGNIEIPNNGFVADDDEIPSIPISFHIASLLLQLLSILMFALNAFPVAYFFSEYVYTDTDWSVDKDPYFWILLPITSWRCVFFGISGLALALFNTFIISLLDRSLLQQIVNNNSTLFSLSGLIWQWSAYLKGFSLLNPSLHNRFVLGGTHFIIGIMKMFGIEIDWTVYMSDVVINECNKVHIKQNSVINGSLLLAHTVENHLLKQNDVTIGSNCCLHPMSRIMPGAIINDSVEVMSLTLIMKNEELNSHMSMCGCPATSMRLLTSNNELTEL